jgi:hypothetical protein
MSYSSSTVNTPNNLVSWSQGLPADGIYTPIVGTAVNLVSATQVKSPINISNGVWLVLANVAVEVNDATTAWNPSVVALYDDNDVIISATSICGEATYADGETIYQAFSVWVNNSSDVYPQPLYIGFTPVFAGSTTAPTVTIDIDLVKIR